MDWASIVAQEGNQRHLDHPADLLPQVLGLESMLGTATLWPLLLALTVLPALLQLVLLPFCPESPRYLYIIRNLEGPARKSELSPCRIAHPGSHLHPPPYLAKSPASSRAP